MKKTLLVFAMLMAAAISSFAQENPDGFRIEGTDLEMYPDLLLSNALQGRLASLVAIGSSNGLGNNPSALYVRGLHSASDNQAITVVDGMERSIDDLSAEEIDRIEILKDASAQILYGPRAANGVILVTTRRGDGGAQKVRASVEYGVKQATRIPSWLGSYDYALLYNEARSNDGLPSMYTDWQLDGYKASSGANDLLYPDTDYYAYFMRPLATFRKVAVNVSGGSDKVRYAAMVSGTGGSGFERYGSAAEYDRVNVRGNVDAFVTDYLSINASISARLKIRSWAGLNQAEMFSQISATRPLAYPMMISRDVLGIPSEDGVPAFGASTLSASNLLADLVYGGHSGERYIMATSDIGINLNLTRYVPGLTAHAKFLLDGYSYIARVQSDVYPTYALTGTNPDMPTFTQMRNLNLSSDQTLTSDVMRLTTGVTAGTAYGRYFGRHRLDASLGFMLYDYQNAGTAQDIVNTNTVLTLTYRYDEKTVVRAAAALMGSNRFARGGRLFPAWSIDAGYTVFPALRLRAGAGILGYDRSTEALLYNTAWQDGGNLSFGEQNRGNVGRTTAYVRTGADLKWEQALEANLGAEGRTLGGRLNYEVAGFYELRSNIICSAAGIYPSVAGLFIPSVNYGKVMNAGVEASVRWKDTVGGFAYQIGLNSAWSANRILQWSEPDYPEAGMSLKGNPSDAIRGFEYVGLYGRDVSLEGAPHQTLGPVHDGSAAYRDFNGDEAVDSRDRKVIGNTFPRLSGGLDVNLSCKNIGLYVQASWLCGMDNLLTNAYYWNYGENKYSVLALDRYHPVNNPSGMYPSLTTTSGTNDFQNSTLWIQNASFFRLKDLELSYTFPFGKSSPMGLKIFFRGTNLIVLSSQKDLDPEVLNAGITNYPYYRTLTFGISFRMN